MEGNVYSIYINSWKYSSRPFWVETHSRAALQNQFSFMSLRQLNTTRDDFGCATALLYKSGNLLRYAYTQCNSTPKSPASHEQPGSKSGAQSRARMSNSMQTHTETPLGP